MIFCVDFSSSSFPSFRNDRKKKSERKGRFQKGSFPTKTKKNCRKKRPINMPSEGKLEGENARKHTLLSINKTPNNTSSLHQMSGFLRPRAALCFLSSRAALYFTKTADDDDDDDGGERKPCLPLNRENRERIFSSLMKGCFFSSFLPFVRYFQRYFLFATKRESKTLALPLLLSLSSHAFNNNNEKNSKTRKELERERKPKSFLFPTTTSYISLSSARERWKR